MDKRVERLFAACEQGSVAEVERCLKGGLFSGGVDIDGIDDLGRTPLGAAINKGQADVVDLLIGKGADPNRGTRGERPLAQAAVAGNAHIVEALARAGADVNARDAKGKSALLVSVEG